MKMLDLAQFQKVKEDEKTATMRHKDGHEMTILIAKLPKIHREQLKRLKMAHGGGAQKDDDDLDTSQTTNPRSMLPADLEVSRQMLTNTNPGVNAPAVDAMAENNGSDRPIDQNLGNYKNAAATQGEATQLAIDSANKQRQIDEAKAQAMVPIEQQNQQNEQAFQKNIANAYNDMAYHTDKFANYMRQNPVDPKHFGQSMPIANKVETALGLLLGGFTGGFSGTGNNPAANWLKDQQEKDIAAQIKNQDNEKTVYGAYRDLYGDDRAAILATKSSWNDYMIHKTAELAQKLGTPQAQVGAEQTISKFLSDKQDALTKAAYLIGARRSGGTGVPSMGTNGQQGSQPGVAAPSMDTNGQSQDSKPNGIVYGPENADKDGTYNIQPILKTNAAETFDDLARRAKGDPAAEAKLGKLNDQYVAAGKADAALKGAKEIFYKLYQNTTPGGWAERHLSGPAEAIGATAVPLFGPAIGAAVGGAGLAAESGINGAKTLYNKYTNSPGDQSEFNKERFYNIYKQKLSDILQNALPPQAYESNKAKLSGIIPESTDTKENITSKMKAFEDLIKTSIGPGYLKSSGMAN